MSSTVELSAAGIMTKTRVTTFYGTDVTVQTRLHAQHAIEIAGFSNQLLVFPDAHDLLERPNLHILDNAGADGYWLAELKKQMKHPENAELVAADIAPFPGETEMFGPGEGISLVKQDMMEEWPTDWEGRFDLIHQRGCVAFHPTWSSALDATRGLLRLLKVGGYVQLVDYTPPYGPIHASDAPHTKFFKSIGRAWSPSDIANGIEPPISDRLAQLLQEATAAEDIELEDVGEWKTVQKIGVGAGSKKLEYLGIGVVKVFVKNVEELWDRSPEVRKMGIEEWEKLRSEVVKETRESGFELETQAVWGRRKA